MHSGYLCIHCLHITHTLVYIVSCTNKLYTACVLTVCVIITHSDIPGAYIETSSVVSELLVSPVSGECEL